MKDENDEKCQRARINCSFDRETFMRSDNIKETMNSYGAAYDTKIRSKEQSLKVKDVWHAEERYRICK